MGGIQNQSETNKKRKPIKTKLTQIKKLKNGILL